MRSAAEIPPDALLRLGAALAATGYSFVTISPPSHRRVNQREGNQLARDLRGVFGWNRPFAPELLPADLLALMRAAGIVEQQAGLYRSSLRVSTLDGRLYFHSAFPTSATDAVFWGPDTYRYAQVLHAALEGMPPRPGLRAVDIGCGAGPGAITVASCWPQAEVWGADINPGALALARVNVALAGMGNVQVRHSNLLCELDGQFDLIVSNPPFMMDTRQRVYCHGGGALGEGLSLDIVRSALQRLAPGGRLVLYTCAAIIDGCDPFRAQVVDMAENSGARWRYREIDPDLFGGELGSPEHQQTDRIAAIALTVTMP